jgi:sec-independent protein translocase protein TatA
VGGVELLVLLTIVLLLFGAKKVPQLGRSLGKGIREFREVTAEASRDSDADGASVAELQAPARTRKGGDYPRARRIVARPPLHEASTTRAPGRSRSRA